MLNVSTISTSLRKAIPLPDLAEYNVHPEDLLVEGNVLCYFKAKGILLDRVSSLALRWISLTRDGLMVVYKKPTEGFILDISLAKEVSSVSDTFKKKRTAYRSCHLKLKFDFGSVHLHLLDNMIPKWRNSISNIFDGNILEETNNADVKPNTVHENQISNTTSTTTAAEHFDQKNNSSDDVLVSTDLKELGRASELSVADFKTAKTSDSLVANSDEEESRLEDFVTVIEVAPAPKVALDKNNDENDTSDSFDTLLERFDRMSTDLDELHSENRKMQKVQEDQKDAPNTTAFKLMDNKGKQDQSSEDDDITDKEENKQSSNSVRRGLSTVASLRKRLESKVGSIRRNHKQAREKAAANRALKQSNIKVRTSIAKMGGTIPEEPARKIQPAMVYRPFAKPLMCAVPLLSTNITPRRGSPPKSPMMYRRAAPARSQSSPSVFNYSFELNASWASPDDRVNPLASPMKSTESDIPERNGLEVLGLPSTPISTISALASVTSENVTADPVTNNGGRISLSKGPFNGWDESVNESRA